METFFRPLRSRATVNSSFKETFSWHILLQVSDYISIVIIQSEIATSAYRHQDTPRVTLLIFETPRNQKDRRLSPPKTIYLYTELLHNYCLYLDRQAMLLAKCYYVTFKIRTVKETTCSPEGHRVTKRYYVSPCKALYLQIFYDQPATKRSLRLESSRGWFAFPRRRLAVIALAWNHFVQTRLVLTWRFTQLVEKKDYMLKGQCHDNAHVRLWVTLETKVHWKVFNQRKSYDSVPPKG